MAGVIPAVELDDVVDAASELVGRLAFAFVAPLGTDNNDCGHDPHSRPQLETRWHNPPGPDVKSLSLTGAALFGRSDRVDRGEAEDTPAHVCAALPRVVATVRARRARYAGLTAQRAIPLPAGVAPEFTAALSLSITAQAL